MHGVLLQDWTTVLSTSAADSVIQSELVWLDVDDYRDAIFWLECKTVVLGGASGVVLAYQTSPTKDESLFSSMSVFPLSATSSPFIIKVLEAQDPSVPLSKWVRWRIAVAGTPSSAWGATFRIFCALNPSGPNVPSPPELTP